MFGADDPQVKRSCAFIRGVLPNTAFSGAPYADVTKILVCMTPRSGSQYFGSLLRDNGLGLAHEHFRHTGGQIEEIKETFGLKSFEDFVRNRIEHNTADGGVFSVKNDWMQFLPLYYLGAHDRYFTDAHFIYLHRRNKLDQAISRYIATESRYFHTTYTDAKDAVADVPYAYDGIKFHLDHLLKMELAWESFFLSEKIDPLRLQYEDLAADPAGVLGSVFAFLGKPVPPVLNTHTEYRKVATPKNGEFTEKFLSDRRARRLSFIRENTDSPL